MTKAATRRAGARIVVTGASPSGTVASSFLRAELDGVHYHALGGANGAEGYGRLEGADMLLFVVDSSEPVDAARTAAVAAAARDRGILVGALVLAGAAAEPQAAGSELLAALRRAADTVVIVRDPHDLRAVVAALR